MNLTMQPTLLITPGSFFSRVFHASPVAMCLASLADGRCVDANEAYAGLLGRSRAELIGRTNRDLQPIDELFPYPPTSPPNSPPDPHPQPQRVYRLTGADGDIKEVLVSAQFEEWRGERYIITLVQDLGRFQQAQDELRRSENRSRLFFDRMPLPIFVFDMATTNILAANKRAAEHYGYSREELSSMNMLDIRPPEEYAGFLDLIQKLSDETERVGIRTHQKRDGTVISVNVTSYALTIEGYHARLGVMQDVTEKQALQKSLQAGEEYLQLIANITSDVIWDLDTSTMMFDFSNGLRTMYGYEGCDYVPLDWWTSHIHPDERDAIAETFQDALAGDSSAWEAQYRFRRFDGTYAYVLDRGYILRDRDGRATRSIGAMVDITRQVELREAAAQAMMRERQRLARDLHDTVTQSLYSLSLMAEAARRLALAGDRKATIDYIVRLGELAQQSLKEMRLLVYESRPTALEKDGLAGAIEARLDAVERRSGIQARLSVGLDDELSADIQTQLFRVAEEALNNALKHASATEVQVLIRSSNGTATLEIGDNGRGFDPAETVMTGGLGLISMQERLEKLGGRFELISEPGLGTTVRVNLDQLDGEHGKHDSDPNLR